MGRASRARRLPPLGVAGTGTYQRIEGERAARWPELVPGVHLWNLITAHRLSDTAARELATGERESVTLDSENLVTIQGPGCLWCEEAWTPAVAGRPCPGDVSA